MATERVKTEAEEQADVLSWWHGWHGNLPEQLLFHIPNEGKRSFRTGKQLREQGLRKGCPDLMLAVPQGGYHGLFIEMKRTKGSHVTPEQQAFLADLQNLGYQTAVCRGAEEAINIIQFYLYNDIRLK